MTNQQHPLTPPPELVQEWREAPEFSALSPCTLVTVTTTKLQDIATRAVDWELNLCCEWLVLNGYGEAASRLRAARRPKPPSLAEEALAEFAEWERTLEIAPDAAIRRALERLQQLEEQQ